MCDSRISDVRVDLSQSFDLYRTMAARQGISVQKTNRSMNERIEGARDKGRGKQRVRK